MYCYCLYCSRKLGDSRCVETGGVLSGDKRSDQVTLVTLVTGQYRIVSQCCPGNQDLVEITWI